MGLPSQVENVVWSYRSVQDDHFFDKEDWHCQAVCYVNREGVSGESSSWQWSIKVSRACCCRTLSTVAQGLQKWLRLNFVYMARQLSHVPCDMKIISGFLNHNQSLRSGRHPREPTWHSLAMWVSTPAGSGFAWCSTWLKIWSRYTGKCIASRVIGPPKSSLKYLTVRVGVGLPYILVRILPFVRRLVAWFLSPTARRKRFNVWTSVWWEAYAGNWVWTGARVQESRNSALCSNVNAYRDHNAIGWLLKDV